MLASTDDKLTDVAACTDRLSARESDLLGELRRAGRRAVRHPHAAGDRELPAGRPAGAPPAGPRLRRGEAGLRPDQPRAGLLGRRDKFAAIEAACQEMIDGRLDEHVVVDALQGGAGTSTNMNVNEVLANRALQLLGRPLGDYATVNPHDDINLHQSTNDTYPTALKVAAISALRELERERGRAAGGVPAQGEASSPTWSRSAAPSCRTPC